MTNSVSIQHRKFARAHLERYTASAPRQFCPNILLTNFTDYFDLFQRRYRCRVSRGSIMSAAHAASVKVSLVNFHIGAPTAALLIDILSCVRPNAVIMLGWCGGLHEGLKVGDWILPIAAIRDEGTSSHYMPPSTPALPTYKVQRCISDVLVRQGFRYRTGIVHSTDYRFWELDRPFIQNLIAEKAIAIEMECSSLFISGLKREVPVGALLLVSDLPLSHKPIKTKILQERLFRRRGPMHLELGVQAVQEMTRHGERVDLRHFEW